MHPMRVPFQRRHTLAGRHVPHLERVVVRRRHDAPPVRGDGNARDLSLVCRYARLSSMETLIALLPVHGRSSTIMGPRHAERAFLATQNGPQRAIVKVEKLKDLAACLRREFPQHRGRPLGLAADAAPDRLNPRERYWTNATLARDEYMKMVKRYRRRRSL